jgi:hypothetical protein
MVLDEDDLCLNNFLSAGNNNFVGFDMVVLDKELWNTRL